MPWEDIIANPRFQQRPLNVKLKIAEGYFKDNIERNPQYAQQDDSARGAIKKSFMQTIGYEYKPEIPDGARAVSDGMQVTMQEGPLFPEPPPKRLTPATARRTDLNETFKAVKSGLQNTLIGLYGRGKMPEEYMPKNTFYSLIESAANILGDLPFYAGFARVGASPVGGAAGAITGGGASFAGVEGIRKVMTDKYEKGEIVSLDDFWQRLKGALVQATKSYGVGAGLGATSKFMGKLGEGTAGRAAQYGAETGYLTLASSIIEGEMPTVESLIHNAGLVGAFKAARIFEQYKEKGIDRVTRKEAERVIEQVEKEIPVKEEKPGAKEIPIETPKKRQSVIEEQVKELSQLGYKPELITRLTSAEREQLLNGDMPERMPSLLAEIESKSKVRNVPVESGGRAEDVRVQIERTPEPKVEVKPESVIEKPAEEPAPEKKVEKPVSDEPVEIKGPRHEYQMTLGEFTPVAEKTYVPQLESSGMGKDISPGRKIFLMRAATESGSSVEKVHRAIIREAILSGKTIPKNVVEPYSDLFAQAQNRGQLGPPVIERISEKPKRGLFIRRPTDVKAPELPEKEIPYDVSVEERTQAQEAKAETVPEKPPEAKGKEPIKIKFVTAKEVGDKSIEPLSGYVGGIFEPSERVLYIDKSLSPTERLPIIKHELGHYADIVSGSRHELFRDEWESQVRKELNKILPNLTEVQQINLREQLQSKHPRDIENAAYKYYTKLDAPEGLEKYSLMSQFEWIRSIAESGEKIKKLYPKSWTYIGENYKSALKQVQAEYPDLFPKTEAKPEPGKRGEELRYTVGGQLNEFMKGKEKPDGSETKLTDKIARETYEFLRGINDKFSKRPLPKYARSINLNIQKNVPDDVKQVEVELGKLRPKKVQTWGETAGKSDKILKNINESAKIMQKVEKGEALNTQEMDALGQIYMGGLNRFVEIARDPSMTLEQYKTELSKFENDIFSIRSEAASEAGRTLNILKRVLAYKQVGTAIQKLGAKVTPEQFKRIQNTNYENPLEVQRLEKYLQSPEIMDYVYEFWYNSILSGIPTHVVNVTGNTLWQAFQIPHRATAAIVDKGIVILKSRQRQYYLDEIVPMITGYKEGFKKGRRKAWQVFRKGEIQEIESKWEVEMQSIIGAFERSPNPVLRATAPYITVPTRALRAMDVWAFSMAYDAELRAGARRRANQRGLTGDKQAEFEAKLLKQPTEEMMKEATEFGKYSTFNNDPGKIANWIIEGRGIVPGGRFIVPFVRTVANLFKRGIEMTPGLGLTLARQNKVPDMIAKQIEGAVITTILAAAINAGHIEMTGRAPSKETEREAFYRSGKRPWAIRIGNHWLEYRRAEPLNTPLAMVSNFLNAAKKYKEGDDALTDIFTNTAAGIVENLVDSSYLQGVTNILDRYGRREGMLKRTAVSFVPYSGFWRSMARAYEAATEGRATVKEKGHGIIYELGQIIPGMSKNIPARLNVWGEEIEFEGGMLRQWLPWKWAKETGDPLEKELERLDIYPGLPGKNVTINKHPVIFEGQFYRDYAIHFGHRAHTILSNVITHKGYQKLSDEGKKRFLDKIMRRVRDEELTAAKIQYVKNWKKRRGQ